MQFSSAQVSSSPASMPMGKQSSGLLAKVKRLVSLRVMLAIIIILQAVLVYFGFRPPFLYEQNVRAQVIAEVSRLTTINPFENPVMTAIADAEKLRKENSIQAEVYKDAKDGDFVIGFTDKIIIFRRNENKIVYEGLSPRALAEKQAKELASDVVDAAVAAKLLDKDFEGTPGLSLVTDPDKLRDQNEKFYASVRKDDVIATFPEESLVIIYRPETGKVVNSGKVSTNIQAI